MKLKDTYITHMSGDTQVLVDAAGTFSGLARSNETAAYIVDCLKEHTDIDGIVEKMLARYDAPEAVIRKDVEKIVGQLKGIGAIED